MQDQRRPEPPRYGVVFRTGSKGPTAGALVVDDQCLMLVGGNVADPVEVSVAYTALVEVRIGRSSEERLNGRPALLLVRRDGPVVQVAPLGFGLLHELADLLAVLAIQQAEGYERVAVVVPLKPGCLERAKELVAKGPPFDPAALGLERHGIYVSERQAVFVFTGPNVREKLEQATRRPTLWRAGLAWRACIAGPPRLTTPGETLPAHHGRPIYNWTADDTPR